MVLMLPKVLVIMQTFLGRNIYPITCKELHYVGLCTGETATPRKPAPANRFCLGNWRAGCMEGDRVSRMRMARRRKKSHFILTNPRRHALEFLFYDHLFVI